MICALIVVSGLALFLAGMITGAVLVFMAEIEKRPDTKNETENENKNAYTFD